MRLHNPRLPFELSALVVGLERWMNSAAAQINNLAEGRLTASHNALTAAPTTGTWATGDFIKNSAPAEAGVALSKYVTIGWICVSGGTPGTWLACRCLTGN